MRWFAVELVVGDWAGLVAWYRDVLGLTLEILDEAHHYALLQAGTARIAIREGKPTAIPSQSRDRLVFEVTDLEATLATLATLGVKLLKPITSSPEGYRRAVIADPEGREIGLFAWEGAAASIR